MKKWPWKQRVEPDTSRELDRARRSLDEHRTRAHGAAWRLAVATGAEQAEIRRNHLGELMHAALTAPGRRDR